MSSGANVTWLSVLEDKQKELTLLNEQGYKIPDGPLEREGLRHGLDQLCKRYKSQSPNRVQLEYKYFDAVRHINDLAKGVTQSHPDLQKRPDHEGLDSLIRRLALATLEVCPVLKILMHAVSDHSPVWMQTGCWRLNACLYVGRLKQHCTAIQRRR